MITLSDILHKINNDVRNQVSMDHVTDITDYISKSLKDFNLAISDDVEQTEDSFKDKYGEGYTYYFPLLNYEHGKTLAFELYKHFTGMEPARKTNRPDFPDPDKLFLVIHLRSLTMVVGKGTPGTNHTMASS